MESKTKFLGHPIHPMLIVIPLGLFIATLVVDTIYLYNGNLDLPPVSYFNIMIGIVGGLLAALFGFLDWLAIPPGTRARYIGGWHGIGNVVVVAMMAVSLWLRTNVIDFVPSQTALIFSYGGVLLGTITAWLGGELVYRLSVGVDSGAHLDAPSSLSEQPTRSPVRTTSSKPARAKR